MSHSRDQAIKACNKAFREYVRWRDSHHGMGGPYFICFCCRGKMTLEYGSVGHFRKTRHLATKWYPRNGHLICPDCQDENKSERNDINYAYWLDQTYGEGTAEAITILSNRDVHYTIHELLDIADGLIKMKSGL